MNSHCPKLVHTFLSLYVGIQFVTVGQVGKAGQRSKQRVRLISLERYLDLFLQVLYFTYVSYCGGSLHHQPQVRDYVSAVAPYTPISIN